MRRFAEGLNDNIRRLLACVRPQSFADLVDRAKNVYLILKETEDRKFGDCKKKGRDFDASDNNGRGEFLKRQFSNKSSRDGFSHQVIALLAPEGSSHKGLIVRQTFVVETQTKVLKGGIIDKISHYVAIVEDPT